MYLRITVNILMFGVCVWRRHTWVHRCISVCTHGCWRPEDSFKCHPLETHLPPLSQGLSLAWNSSGRLGWVLSEPQSPLVLTEWKKEKEKEIKGGHDGP